MLYPLISFVGLFIVAITIAIIFYIKDENDRKTAADAQTQLEEIANTSELQKIGTIVGTKQGRKSRLGTMTDYLNEMVSLIVGGLPEVTSAEVKVETAKRQFKETLAMLAGIRVPAKSITPLASTNEFVELLAKEQFPKAADSFDEKMKKSLPAEKLAEAWKSTIGQAGPFKQQIGSRTEKQAPYDVVFVTCEFEKGPLDIKLVHNEKKQIAGLFFVPVPQDVLKSYQGNPEQSAPENIDIGSIDPNTIGLIGIIERLKAGLDDVKNAKLALKEQFEQTQNRFDDSIAAGAEKEKALMAEKEKYAQQVDSIKKDYNDLQVLMKQTTDQQVQTLLTQRDDERTSHKNTHQELLKTQAQLGMTEERVKKLQGKLPSPDRESAMFKPDGKILLIDSQAKIVHLNIGKDDRVYPGMTFSVYDKDMPIPKDGRGKAEIEVFDVEKNISKARIIHSEKKRPVSADDIVANLIWDSGKTNVFVVAGEFDLDNNGEIDPDAADKIKTLIEKWGGKTADTVSADTDFVVLGRIPIVRQKPTSEEMEMYPTAMEKYEESLRRLARYKEIQNKAETLSIPVLNYERFLYLIGYKTQSNKPGAF